ncbi:MAG: hypothetical protein EP299_09540 [Acidobacteria bacterium]|nr:MAG: hypothetical protein EP299_09540 [Acidobacteriota bacterium]
MMRGLSCWLLGICCIASLAAGQQIDEPEAELVDRILAVVDEDPILDSDLDQAIGIGLIAPEEGEAENDYRRRVLDLLIDQKVRFHEIDLFGFSEIPVAEVDRQFDQVREQFASDDAFSARLEEVGLDEQGLRQILARQMMVLIYVEERLGARVFVGLDEIQQYYHEVLVPELEEKGQPVPPQQEVREEIRAVLREMLLNEEIERWTEQLRQEADIVDFFDSPREELPPLVISSQGQESDG